MLTKYKRVKLASAKQSTWLHAVQCARSATAHKRQKTKAKCKRGSSVLAFSLLSCLQSATAQGSNVTHRPYTKSGGARSRAVTSGRFTMAAAPSLYKVSRSECNSLGRWGEMDGRWQCCLHCGSTVMPPPPRRCIAKNRALIADDRARSNHFQLLSQRIPQSHHR